MKLPNSQITLTCLVLFIAFLYCPGSLKCQEAEEGFRPYIYLNANVQAGLPVQEFYRSGQQKSYGGGGLLLVQVGRRPLFAGLEFSLQRMDSENLFFEEVVNGYLEEFEQTTNNNALFGHVVFRFQPWDNSLFRPYVDGLFGVKNFFTRTTLENLETEETQNDTERKDWSLSYGFAGGLQLGVFLNQAITIDLRLVYLTGRIATFMVRDPDAQEPFFSPIEAFAEKNAPASMLIPQIGITVDLTTVEYY